MRTFTTILFWLWVGVIVAQQDSLHDGFSWRNQTEVLSTHYRVADSTFNQGMLTDPLDALRGQLPGLLIARNGNDPNRAADARTRGLSSIVSHMSPLVVVDGMPNVPLQTVDPDDIAHVEWLSGGEALARYGAQGAGGVLLVQTHRATDDQELRAQYRGAFSFDRVDEYWQSLDRGDFTALQLGEDFGSETDWQREITRPGFGQLHTLSASQLTKYGLRYYIGWHFRQARGVLNDQGFTQTGGRIQLEQKLLQDKLTLSLGLNLQNRDAELGQPEAIRYAMSINPTAPVFSDAFIFSQYDGYFQDLFLGVPNPVWQQDWGLRQQQSRYLLGQVNLQYEWLPGLVTEGRIGLQQFTSETGSFAPLPTTPPIGTADYIDDAYNSSFVQLLTHYRKQTSQMGLQITVGIQRQMAEQIQDRISAGILVPSDLPVDIRTTEQTLQTADTLFFRETNVLQEEGLTSAFGFVNWNLKEILYLSGSLRFDQALFRTQINPGGSAAFRFDGLGNLRERGLQLGRVRVSYGQGAYLIRNQPFTSHVTPFQLSEIFPTDGQDSNDPAFGLNPDIVRSTDVGIDMVGKKFSFHLTYYQRNTLNPWVDAVFGFASSQVAPVVPVANLAIRNRGIEARMGWQMGRKNVRYTGFVQLTTFQNDLILREGVEGDFTLSEDWEVFLRQGSPGSPGFGVAPMVRLGDEGSLGEINGPRLDVDATQLTGESVFIDLNGQDFGNGEAPLGNGVPNWTLGIFQQLAIGNLRISGLLRGDFGHQLVNISRLQFESQTPRGFNAIEFDGLDLIPGFPAWSDNFVENASYLTLDNLGVQYAFQFGKGRQFLLGLVARNLFTLSNYSGLDPSPRFTDQGIFSDETRAEFGRGYFYSLIGLDRRSGVYATRSWVLTLGLDI